MMPVYLQERIHRTTNRLALGFGDLRVRLPEAYDVGLGTVASKELSEFSHEVTRTFECIKSKLSLVKDNDVGWAAASANKMSDDDLVWLAQSIFSFSARVDTEIEHRKGTP